MTDELEQMTPNQRRALDKALAALEAMASIWASEIRLTDMSQKIANVTDPTMRAKRIAAMVEQAFIEGAYRHYLDHKDGILHVDALEAANARIAELEAERDALLAAAGKKAVAWECSSPAGEKPALAFLTSKKPTVEHYEEQGWRVTPLCLCAPTAALAQPLEAQADARWQPIETAPKDGTPLILFARSIHATASIPIFGWFLDEYGWIAQSFRGIEKIIPSHWMPRPEFPADLSQKAGEQG